MSSNIVAEFSVKKSLSRNTNGTFLTLRDGRILFLFNSCLNQEEPQRKGTISKTISEDGGASWSFAKAVISSNKQRGELADANASLLRLNDGRILLMYNRGDAEQASSLCVRSSADEGATWSEETSLIDVPGYFVTRNDGLVRIASGRIIVALTFHTLSTHDLERQLTKPAYVNYNAITRFLYSDDDGKTWRFSGNMLCLNVPCSKSGLQEPVIVELNSGVLWGLARTDLGRQYEFFSFDNGISWTSPEPSSFSGSCSPLAIKHIHGHNTWLIAVWNPVPEYLSQTGKEFRARSRLVYAVSKDDGVTWAPPVILENNPTDMFSHAAIQCTPDGVLISYDVVRMIKGTHSSVRIRRIAYDVL